MVAMVVAVRSSNNSAGSGGGGYSGGNGGTIIGTGGGSINYGTNQVNTAGDNNGGGVLTIQCLGSATFGAIISAPQPVCGNANGSINIDLTGDADGSTSGGVEYAFVSGNSFTGSTTFADINTDPFTANTGTSSGTFTVRVRLKYNPTLFTDYTYTFAPFTQFTWYLDADGDGYYTGSGINACTSPGSGYRSTGLLGGGDCNDDNTAIHPGATEVCNGIDDNCDGQIDEGTSITTSILANGPTTFCSGSSVLLTAAMGNTAIQLNGTDQYFITPDLTSYFSNGSFTIELWFKANSDGVIVSEVGQSTINTNWHDSHIDLLPNGHVMVRVWNMSGVDLGTVSLGTWHHAAVRYNAATTTLDGLLDGSPSATNTSGTRQTPSANGFAQYWAFGAADGTNLGSGKYFNGQLDEIRIWNTAVSNAQIASNYNKSIAPNAAGLVAYYKADETSGSTANDATANTLHASLANTPTHVIPSGNALNAPSYLWSTTATTPVITAASSGGYYVTATVSGSLPRHFWHLHSYTFRFGCVCKCSGRGRRQWRYLEQCL